MFIQYIIILVIGLTAFCFTVLVGFGLVVYLQYFKGPPAPPRPSKWQIQLPMGGIDFAPLPDSRETLLLDNSNYVYLIAPNGTIVAWNVMDIKKCMSGNI